ncbi:MAG: hypothetical protein J6V00_07750 [Bacteroidaceae bacterium]|nr:hypothetical protein [Bacteroidaceae bacterium]
MTDNLRRLAETIAKLHKAEWELISLRHDLQRQYEALERQEASALELDIPEEEILATLVKNFPVDVNNTPGRSTVTIHNISISKPTATEALVLMYKVLKLRGAL